MKKIILPLLILATMASCSSDPKGPQKKGSSGKTLEVLLVADRNVYCEGSSTMNLVDSLFKSPQVGLPQGESKFDVVNVPLSSFRNTEMFQKCRNIIVCNIGAENPNKLYFNADKWAEPQVVFEFAVKNAHDFDSLLCQYYPTITKEIYRAEYRRIANAFAGMPGVSLMDEVKQKFNFGLTISDEFEMAKLSNPTENMGWIRKEAKDFGIGVLINIIPYTDNNIFREENLLNQVDTLMKHVEGPADNSYMATERRVNAHTQMADFEQSAYAVETRGLWRLFGDFMGGPYVAYALLTPDNKNVVLMVAYAYCPRFDKRDYLMQVQGICHSIKF